jgi:hypothetical protein
MAVDLDEMPVLVKANSGETPFLAFLVFYSTAKFKLKQKKRINKTKTFCRKKINFKQLGTKFNFFKPEMPHSSH